jgi:hypothetical protein
MKTLEELKQELETTLNNYLIAANVDFDFDDNDAWVVYNTTYDTYYNALGIYNKALDNQ